MNDKSKCQFCDSELIRFSRDALKEYNYMNCPACGEFTFHDLAFHIEELDKINNYKAILSYWIRNHQSPSNKIFLSADLVRDILRTTQLPKPQEQADNLLLYIGEKVNKPDELFHKKNTRVSPNYWSN
jgi:hypothetical protein